MITLKNYVHHSQLGAPQKEKNPGALGTCPVCPLVNGPGLEIWRKIGLSGD